MNTTLSTRQIRLVALLVLIVVAAGGFLVATKHKSTTSTTRTTASSTPAKLQTHGLPVTVARALQKHSVVVVSLTTPRGADDQATSAEAQAGATEMGAGYVAIDVFHQRPGTAILHKLGVVDTPDVLVVKRNGTIFSYFHGFVDRDVVAQAVADAR